MLYDPKWEQKTKANPFSLASLIAWLETMPPDRTYDWMNCSGGCLIGEYFKAKDIEGDDYIRVFRNHPNPLAYGKVCSSQSGPTTFGAALERARALLTS